MSISISASVDISFGEIAEEIANDCNEAAFLDELARENASVATQSDDKSEREFAFEAAKRLYALAEWFRENQP